MGQCLGDRLVRQGELLVRSAEEHECPFAVGLASELAREASLARPRLASDEHDLPITGPRVLPSAAERGELTGAADEPQTVLRAQGRGPRHTGGGFRRKRLPQHSGRGEWLWEALELEVPDGLEAIATPAAGHEPHHVRDQDLAGTGGGDQARRLDDRLAEAVALAPGDVADGDADA